MEFGISIGAIVVTAFAILVGFLGMRFAWKLILHSTKPPHIIEPPRPSQAEDGPRDDAEPTGDDQPNP